jgi:hypothetical protein
VVEEHGVAVQVAEGGEVADPGVPRLGDELDAFRFEFRASLGNIGHPHCEAGLVRDERQFVTLGLPEKLRVTFGVSSSPSDTSLSGSPRTSRYHAIARATFRVGMEMKSTWSTRTVPRSYHPPTSVSDSRKRWPR